MKPSRKKIISVIGAASALLVFNAIVLSSSSSSVSATQMQNNSSSETEESKSYNSLESLFSLYQPYLQNISAYNPIYFLVGTAPEKSKFQLSFKYRLFDIEGAIAGNHPWVKGLHFAYTQTSFWDLKSASRPFEDTSYKPELFFISPNLYSQGKTVKRLFLQTGFQHESNGQSGMLSRSTNFYYLKPIFIFFNENNLLGLQVSPQLKAYFENDNQTNPHLEDYRGYIDLEIKYGEAKGFVLESHFLPAKEGNSIILDLTSPMRKLISTNLDYYFHVEYVNALAENLRNYNQRSEAFRIGISIIR